jgi:hypothetical protein
MKRKMTPDKLGQAKELRAKGLTYQKIGEVLEVSVMTIYDSVARTPEEKKERNCNRNKRRWHGSLLNRCCATVSNSRAQSKKGGYVPLKACAEQLMTAYQNQEGKCAICGKSESMDSKRLNADHNHITGEFRGWLCNKCNSMLGIIDAVGIDAIIGYAK